MTYQQENFLQLLEKFNEEYLKTAKERENADNEWRSTFIAEYPREAIDSMQIKDYLISKKRTGNAKSFCRSLCSVLKNVFHINVGDNAWVDTFGIAIRNGMQLMMSKDLTVEFGSDYDKAFAYIKNEIVTLLNEVDKGNYTAVEYSKLSYDMKYLLLIIYCPNKILPVFNVNLLFRYCERTGIAFRYYREIIYCSNLLIHFKDDIPEFSDWSYSIFTSFCDWLYRNNRSIDGDLLRKEACISAKTIIEEVDTLKLQGREKEAVRKM